LELALINPQVSIPAYWLSSWIWDIVSYLPAFALTLITVAAFNVTSLIGCVAFSFTSFMFSIAHPVCREEAALLDVH
jgi:hypothetical protein